MNFYIFDNIEVIFIQQQIKINTLKKFITLFFRTIYNHLDVLSCDLNNNTFPDSLMNLRINIIL